MFFIYLPDREKTENLTPTYYEAASQPKQLWAAEGGHTGAIDAEPQEYEQRRSSASSMTRCWPSRLASIHQPHGSLGGQPPTSRDAQVLGSTTSRAIVRATCIPDASPSP